MSDETRSADRPATFSEVFRQREYRAVYTAVSLASLGDFSAKVAVTALVYQETSSVGWSAAAFAISYLPWLLGGPLLATVAERHPYRTVMVTCDIIRFLLIAVIAIPGVPVWAMLCVLFLTTLATAPSAAARSALMPLILEGDRLVLGLSLNNTTNQVTQIAGYGVGAGLAIVDPRVAILFNAVTWLLSAALIRFGVHHRPPALAESQRSHLLRETGEGFRLVFGSRELRAIAILVFSAMLFAIVPEGLAAAWASEKSGGGAAASLNQALIMAASALGFIAGGLTMARLVPPPTRRRLVRPFAVIAPLALVPALFDLSPAAIAGLTAVSGFCVAGLMPVANSLFVQALPHGTRARAFGVMATGVQVAQGFAVFATGMLADRFEIPVVVGLWSLAGVALMLATSTQWPTSAQFDEIIARAAAANAKATATATTAPDPAASEPKPDDDQRPGPPEQRTPSSGHRPATARP